MKDGTILDHRGQPVQTKQLQTELATPTASVRETEFDSMADGLTPSKLAGILKDIQEDPSKFLTLAIEMEERELHYGSVLSTRKLAVSGIPATVEAPEENENEDVTAAVEQLVKAPNFTFLTEDLLDGLGKGFSVCEINWSMTADRWMPIEYHYRDPRWFKFNYKHNEEIRLRTEGNEDGIPLAPFKFIVHYPRLRSGLKIRGGLARLACVAYMCKNYDLKDWMRFLELFGMPMRLGRYDSNANDRDKEILKRAVTALGVNSAAILPKGMEIDFQELGNVSAGATIYERLANWLDKQISKAVLGQTMTADDGSSQSQAQVHDEVRGDILKKDARTLEATINEQLIRPFVDLNFGIQESYPVVKIPVEDPEDLKDWAEYVSKLINCGLKVSQKHVRDKLGLPDPEDDEELLMPSASAASDPAGRATAANSWRFVSTPNPASSGIYERALNRVEEDAYEEILAGAIEGWEAVEDETFKPLHDRLQACNSYEEMKAVLDDADMDTGELTALLATAAFKARGSADHK